jgi:hypothetical protein
MKKTQWKELGIPGYERLKKLGYKYIVQFKNTKTGKLFGEPLAFKSSNDVGPFMRTNPELKMVWTRTIEDQLEILTDRPYSTCKDYDE